MLTRPPLVWRRRKGGPSMYAAYGVIPGPKWLLLALETGHFTTPEQSERVSRWLETLLKTGKSEH